MRPKIQPKSSTSGRSRCHEGSCGGGCFSRCCFTAYGYGKTQQVHGNVYIDWQWVPATMNLPVRFLGPGRLLDPSNLNNKYGCHEGSWGGGCFSGCCFTAYGYGKIQQAHANVYRGQQWVFCYEQSRVKLDFFISINVYRPAMGLSHCRPVGFVRCQLRKSSLDIQSKLSCCFCQRHHHTLLTDENIRFCSSVGVSIVSLPASIGIETSAYTFLHWEYH